VIRFGPFQIDPRTWTLTRDGEVVDLSPRLVEILAFFASRPGDIITKEDLLDRFWAGVNISENTLTRAIADIRIALGDSASEPTYIQTFARRGYRFLESATQSPQSSIPSPKSSASARATANKQASSPDPFEDWVKGRLALESLDLTQLPAAIAAFERAVAELPSYAPAYAGLANAYLMQFETTRFTNVPDRALLDRAITAARRSCSVDPTLGEGWAVLGYLLYAAGQVGEGQAAARRAAALEPDNWRHQFRLAYSTWGEERLRAADRVLSLMPTFAAAHMLAATVFVARGALARAEQEATRGAELQRQGHGDHMPMQAAGLHWVRGLVMAARGEPGEALQSFDEEIAASAEGHVYGREFASNAQVAAGFILLSRDDHQPATEKFTSVLASTPTHARATLGLAAARIRSGEANLSDDTLAPVQKVIDELSRSGRSQEAALVQAGREIVRGRVTEALAVLDQLLDQAPAGPAGWIIPVDPMLTAVRFSSGRAGLLAKLAARAS
jgi:DNA-binding winged helix-turn-helix (wHTH) protein